VNLPHEAHDFAWWQEPGWGDHPVDFRVSRSFFYVVDHFLRSHHINYTVLVEDVQQHFKEARVESGDGDWDKQYHPYDAPNGIVDWLKAAANQNPSFVSLFTLGNSVQGRPIYGLKIGKDTTNKNPVIYLDGGIHAREWMAPATIEYIIGQFVNNTNDAIIEIHY